MTVQDLARKFFDLRTKYDEQKAVLDAINADWTEIETQLIDAMVEEGVPSIKLEGIGTFSMATTNYLSVNVADQSRFYDYLKRAGHGGILKEYVNPRTLTAFLKEHMASIAEKFEQDGLDQVDARQQALKFLNERGAAYFTKREVRLLKK